MRGRRIAVELRNRLFPNAPLPLRVEEGWLPFYQRDVVAESLWFKGRYENAERAAVRRLVRDCEVVLDVGANLGLYALIAARHAPRNCTVIAFEASPREYQHLLQTLRWNNLRQVIAEKVAVSDTDGELGLYESVGGWGALNRVDRPARDDVGYELHRVPAVTIDTYLHAQEYGKVGLMKVDVEGHELPVLRGAAATIERDRPVLMVEMNDRRSSDASTPLDVWAFLASRSYVWHHADPDGTLWPFPKPATFGYLNLFAVPCA